MTMTLIGGYRFSDYMVVGGTLSVLCLIVALVALPLFYGL
jgi:di/tricarboxylate transporter